MALIPKFTNTDPNARVSFSFKRSSRRQLDLYRHFYKEQYEDADLPERGPLVEQIVVALLGAVVKGFNVSILGFQPYK